MMRQFMNKLRRKTASVAAATTDHPLAEKGEATLKLGLQERLRANVEKLNTAYKAGADARRAARQRRHAWQVDEMAQTSELVHFSPGVIKTGVARALRTKARVRMLDGTVYAVYTDGSFRLVDAERRRPAGLSGRQRRIGRKVLRHMVRWSPERKTAYVAAVQARDAASRG